MNCITLCGRISKDWETRTANNDMVVGRTGLAVNRKKKDDPTDFFNIVAFGKTAEVLAKYTSKGSQLLIRGHVQIGSYTDKDGNKRQSFDVIVDEFDFIGSSKGETKSEKPKEVDSFMNAPEGVPEELPF